MIEPQTEDIEQLLISSGAMLRGHFLLTSGRHSDVYVEKFRILEQPHVLSRLCAQIAARFANVGVDLVAGPTTGGIIIAFEVARQLGTPSLYVESENGVRTLRRGASVPEGARVLIVDDVLTTGTSVLEVAEVVSSRGGIVAGVGVLIDRSQVPLAVDCPVFAAHRVEAVSYAPDEIPAWLSEIPIMKPGTRVSDNRERTA